MNYKTFVLLITFGIVLGALGATVSVAAQPRSVGQGSGFDFNTIQAAINASNDGDSIVVSPGTYAGSINFLTKNIHLMSTNPSNASVREATILAPPDPIDASSNGSLQGFRINGQ